MVHPTWDHATTLFVYKRVPAPGPAPRQQLITEHFGSRKVSAASPRKSLALHLGAVASAGLGVGVSVGTTASCSKVPPPLSSPDVAPLMGSQGSVPVVLAAAVGRSLAATKKAQQVPGGGGGPARKFARRV